MTTTATPPRPRILVAYYSRTGNTRRVAKAIAAELGADLEPIVDRTDRRGFFGYLRAARDAMRGRAAEIDRPRHEPATYDLLIVGTPVWVSSLTPAVRTFLGTYGGDGPELAFFLTFGGAGQEKVFSQMADLCARPPLAALAIRESELASPDWEVRVRAFAAAVGMAARRRGNVPA